MKKGTKIDMDRVVCKPNLILEGEHVTLISDRKITLRGLPKKGFLIFFVYYKAA